MRKNVASQIVMAQLISKTDGSAVTTGTTLVYSSVDGAPQSLVAGSPSAFHLGQGVWEYVCTAAESNGDHIAFTFVNSSACNVTVQIYTSYPQTGDNYARIGAPAGASVSADIAAVKADTAAIKTKTDFLPSATAGAAGGVFIAGTNAATTITTSLTTTFTGSLTGSVASVTGAVGSVTGLTASDVGAIKTVTDKVGDTLVADGSPGNFRFSTNALAGVWDSQRGGHAIAGTFGEGVASVQGNVTGSVASVTGNVGGNVTGSVGSVVGAVGSVTGLTASDVGNIKTVTDKLNDTFTSDSSPANYRFSAAALALAPTGGSAPSAATVAAAVWDEARAGHVSAGTFGEGVASVQGNVTGSTASVTGAVGSVTGNVGGNVTGTVGSVVGAVGSVTGNVGGNVTGTVGSVVGAVGSVTGNVGGNVTGSVGSVAAGGITASSIATDAIDADAIASDAITEIQNGLATAAALSTVAGYVDTEVAAIKAVTDKLNTTLVSANSPTDWVFTAQSLAQAPGGSGLTTGAIADAVWDELIAGHLGAGSTGLALNDATAAGNPWNSVLEGTLTGGDLLRVAASFAAGKDTITDNGNGSATVVFRDASDTTDLITGTVVGSSRTSVTITP